MNELSPLLADTWGFYKRHLIPMCALIFPFVIPLDILYSFANFFSTDKDQVYWLAMIPGVMLFPIYQGALILYIASAISGDYLQRKQYYRFSLQRWLPLMVLYFVMSMAILGGFLLLIFPALIVMARISFSEFYCILFQQKPMSAFSTSWEQTKDYQWLLIFGITVILVVTGIPVWAGEKIITSLDLWNPVLIFIFSVLSSVLTIPYTIFCFRVFTKHQETLKS